MEPVPSSSSIMDQHQEEGEQHFEGFNKDIWCVLYRSMYRLHIGRILCLRLDDCVGNGDHGDIMTPFQRQCSSVDIEN